MNSDMGKAVLFIFLLNFFFFGVQLAIAKEGINSMNGSDTITSPISFFNYDESLLKSVDIGNYSLNEDLSSEIPQGTNTIDSNTDNFFTDTWKTIRGWILDIPGANTVYNVVNALPHFLTAMGMDYEMVFGLGAIWHLLTVFLIVNWLKGG